MASEVDQHAPADEALAVVLDAEDARAPKAVTSPAQKPLYIVSPLMTWDRASHCVLPCVGICSMSSFHWKFAICRA